MTGPSPVPFCATNVKSSRSDQTRQGILVARAGGLEWGRGAKQLAAKNKAQATAFAESLRPLVVTLMIKGLRRPSRLARELNRLTIATREGGRWHSATVTRLVERLGTSLKTDIEAAKYAALSEQQIPEKLPLKSSKVSVSTLEALVKSHL